MSTVVTVNGEKITDAMLEKAIARYFIQMEEDEEVDFNPNSDNMKYLRTESLNYLIERRLLLQLARKVGLQIPDDIILSRIQELKSGFESEADWLDNLISLRIKEDELYGEIRDDLVIELLIETLAKETIEMSDESLRQFFDDNQPRMKEPDLYSFYEVAVNSPDQVNTVALIINDKCDIGSKKDKLKAFGLELSHYSDLESGRIPEQILNVLSDLQPGKLGTMLVEEKQLVLYKLISFKAGKKFEFEEIKDHLAVHLEEQARKELYSKLVNEQMIAAEIDYVDLTLINRK